ncbi:ATP-grasp domain-containing protein [Streptomyces sp. NPDC005727]|uniref:ATP-grasp domain-containing protein n=1 Tax=Streptomyces sp. NPDC005727 TaxID=3157053 RepID=UPI0033C0021D
MRRPARDRPLLAIAYDDGAVSPGEVAVALGELGDVVFLVPDTAHVASMRPVLTRIGEVRDLSGDARADAEAVRQLAPDALVTFSERMIRATAELARSAELPYHSPDTALLLTDKTRQRAALRAAGVDDLRTAPLDSLADWPAAFAHVGLPAVVKPVRGAGSRHTHPVRDEEEALRVLTEIFTDLPPAPSGEPRLTLEEMLVGRDRLPLGDYTSVESLCGPEGVTHLAVSGKFPLVAPFREPGRYWPIQLPEDERLAVLDLVTRALEALGVQHGLTHTEVKLTPDGPRLVEVNGRLGGHVNGLARTSCGVDLVHAAVLQALGRPTGLGPLRPDRVHFQHNGLAPLRPCRLVSVDGAAAVRGMAGISGYRTFVRPDEQLPGGVMTRELDVLWGVADTHEEMVRLVRDALENLHYTFDFTDPRDGVRPPGGPTGLRTVAASSCGAWQDLPAPEPACEPIRGAARGLAPEPIRGPALEPAPEGAS